MEHQTCTYEQPQMDVIVTDGGVTTDGFGINIAASVIEGNPEGGIFSFFAQTHHKHRAGYPRANTKLGFLGPKTANADLGIHLRTPKSAFLSTRTVPFV